MYSLRWPWCCSFRCADCRNPPRFALKIVTGRSEDACQKSERRRLGVSKNSAEAVKLLKNAAQNGNAGGQYALGILFVRGEGVEKNAQEAVRRFRLAADQGVIEAAAVLGVPVDFSEAVR